MKQYLMIRSSRWASAAPTIVAVASVVAIVLLPGVAHAQHSGNFGQSTNPANNSAYFTSGDYTLQSDISGNDVFVGKTDTNDLNTNFQTFTPTIPITLTVDTGATTTFNGAVPHYPDGLSYQYTGINMLGGNSLRVRGGTITQVNAYDNSRVRISGGTISAVESYNDSVTDISGGYIPGNVQVSDEGTANISGGDIATISSRGNAMTYITGGESPNVVAEDNSTTWISGGKIGQVLSARDTTINVSGGILGREFIYGPSHVNFYGSGFTAVYTVYAPLFDTVFDDFAISGTLHDGTILNNFPLYIQNTTGTGDSTFRQVTFNSAVVVPEASTLAMVLLSASGIAGHVIMRRRKLVA